MKNLIFVCFIFISVSIFGDEIPKCGITVTVTAGASATIINPAVIGLDTLTKKIYYTDTTLSTYFKSDTVKGGSHIFLLHFN